MRARASMLGVWLAVAACDLQPPPKPQPAPAGVASDAATATATGDAGVKPTPDALAVTNDCESVGVHVAQVLIDSKNDPSLKSSYEQARTKVVRATAEACTTQSWSSEAQQCYLDAKTEADVRACEKKFPPPPVPGSPPDRPHSPTG